MAGADPAPYMPLPSGSHRGEASQWEAQSCSGDRWRSHRNTGDAEQTVLDFLTSSDREEHARTDMA